MLALTILRVKNIKIKFTNSKRIYSKYALFFPKFWAKIMWVLAILRVENVKIKIIYT
jgi:hypothetical protein